MRFLFLFLIFFPCSAFAENPQTFNNMTFGQPPEVDMICVKGPCSTKQIRPDVKQNKIEIGEYVRPIDITIYGDWQITPPIYTFYKDKFVKVRFDLLCDQEISQRCMDETLLRLQQEYDLEFHGDASMVFNESQAMQNRTYQVGKDMLVKITYQKNNDYWRLPSVLIENIPMMEALRHDARSSLEKPAPDGV